MPLHARRRPPAPEFVGEAALKSGRFAVVSDFQRTSRAELWRERNRDERRLIVEQIAHEAPDFLVVLGDLVFSGSSPAHWAEFDLLTAPLREAGIPMLPVLGNHEYWMSPRRALPAFFARFPHIAGRHWYSLAYGGLELLFLDSNRRWMTPARWDEQLAWYRDELARLDGDPSLHGALVLLHHPPYTNSTVTSDERHVQRACKRRIPVELLRDLFRWSERAEGLRRVYLDIKLEEDQVEEARLLFAAVREFLHGKPRGRGPSFHLMSVHREIVEALLETARREKPAERIAIYADFERPGVLHFLPRVGARCVGMGRRGRFQASYRSEMARVIKACRSGKLTSVVAWMINEEKKLRALLRMGTPAIMTDEIERLRRLAKRRGPTKKIERSSSRRAAARS